MTYNVIARYLVAAVVGGVIGVISTRTYYKKKCRDETEKRIAEFLEVPTYLDPIIIPADTEDVIDAVPVTPAENIVPKSATGAFDGGKPMESYKNYADIYKVDENAHPTEDEDYIGDAEGELMTKERNESNGPRVMEWEEIGMPGLGDELTLLWHIDERWMETEDGEVIDDPFALVGNCLQESGFDISNQRSIHIINERRGETYEVLKVTGRSM